MIDVAELVTRSRQGDVDAFTELVRRYQSMAFGYARATISDTHLAEDATQQAFLLAYQNIGSLRDPVRFGGWLRGIVRFECLRVIRSSRRYPTITPLEEQYRDPGNGPDALVESDDSLRRTIAALDELPEHERVVAFLFYIHDQSQREVAEFLSLPVSTINNRLRSARKHLRKGVLSEMSNNTLNNGQQRDFSKGVGEVLRAHGAIVDVAFGRENRPELLNSVSIDGMDDVAHSAFVSQYLDDDVVRLVVTGTHKIQPGMKVRDRDTAVLVPLTDNDVRDVVTASRSSRAGAITIDTGIKVVDLFVPIIDGGTVAIVGDMNVGKMVLVEELFQRLSSDNPNVTILVFLHAPTEIESIRKLEYRSSGKQTAIILPVADASPEALEPALRSVDSVIVLSRELAVKHFYPAVDPLRSRVLDRHSIESNESVERARLILGSETTDAKLKLLIRNYLTQPFYVAEAFTGLQGQSVSKSVALDELSRILNGEFDDRSVEELFMKGSISLADGRNSG